MVRQALFYFATILDKSELDIPQTDIGPDNVNKILAVVFSIFGGIALIIIIMGGIKFMTSQGNPEGVAKARNTIIYAAIGLAISIGALSIVTFVTGRL